VLRLTVDDGVNNPVSDDITITIDASGFLYGDVTENGNVSAYDASLAARYAVGFINLTPEQITRANVDGDNNVTQNDAGLIARKAVDASTAFSGE